MRKLFLTTAAVLALAAPAKADLVLFNPGNPGGADGTPTTSFIDVRGFGFGDIHRLLTLQTNLLEAGGWTPIDVPNGQAVLGADKGGTPTLGSLGWLSRDAVGLFFDADQTGGTGITLQSLAVTIYNGTTAVGTFSTPHSYEFTAADLALEPGNGSGGFFFSLTAPQQAQFDAILGMAGAANFRVGLQATLGCTLAQVAAGCSISNDGPDSFNAVNLAAVPGPIAGAGLPGLLAGIVGLWGLAMKRRRRNGGDLPA